MVLTTRVKPLFLAHATYTTRACALFVLSCVCVVVVSLSLSFLFSSSFPRLSTSCTYLSSFFPLDILVVAVVLWLVERGIERERLNVGEWGIEENAIPPLLRPRPAHGTCSLLSRHDRGGPGKAAGAAGRCGH